MAAAAVQRGLATASTADGRFHVLAIDHRDSLRVAMNPDAPASVPDAALVDFKLDVVRAIAPLASAVMLETEFALPAAITSGALPGGVGFLTALEAQGYLAEPAAGPTVLMDDWSPAAAKTLGASGAKLLVHYDPALADHAAAQEAVAADAVRACRAAGIPLFLEPLLFGDHGPDEWRRLVIETARRMGALGPDVLKLPFPLPPAAQDQSQWRSACAELTATSPVPWALLSAGVGFDQFAAQYEVAAGEGCAGFMVGRALWKEALPMTADDRRHFLATTATTRFQTLAALA